MSTSALAEEALTRSVIGAFYEVYNSLGYGFVESIYKSALVLELVARGHHVGREVPVRINYKGAVLAVQRIDLVVDERVVVEVKSTFDLHPSAARQLFNYLHATSLTVGLLLHFGPNPKVRRVYSGNPI